MNKELNKELMTIAEEVLQSADCPLYKEPGVIHESYNGQVSALGVSVLMIGLKATLAVYYSDTPKKEPKEKPKEEPKEEPKKENKAEYYDKAYRKLLLDVIVKMINRKYDTGYANTTEFVRAVMSNDNEELKTRVINCSVALKQVIRTYKMN